MSSPSTYNYERFDEHVMSGDSSREFAAFPKRLHAGETAPDGAPTLLGGERLRLSDLWRHRGIVLEFGSFTWPYCAAEGPLLDQLASRYEGWGWYFLYTREAHPGEHQGQHRTIGEKLAAARRLRDEVGISRPILVDDLDGAVHRAYGTMPNMTWVLGRRGVILYKAQWTVARSVREFLDRFGEQPLDATHVPFHTEQLEVRRRGEQSFFRGLERNGPRAVAEYRRVLDFWTTQAREAKRPR